MIRAIIFDCFGVLTSDGWLPFKHHYFGYEGAAFDKATELAHRAETQLLSYDALIAGVAKMARISAVQAHHEIQRNVANEPLFELIEHKLKPKYKLGILSNAANDQLAILFSKSQLALFDATVLSFEIGVIKPDPRAYEGIAGRLGVSPAECLFIDDQKGYCDGAVAVGMQAHQFTSVPELEAYLAKVLA
jgi:HAD superfamily hydrolase (TIGR01509 family)